MMLELKIDLKIKAVLLVCLCLLGAFTCETNKDCRLLDNVIREMSAMTDRCNAQLERAENASQMVVALERYVADLNALKPKVRAAQTCCGSLKKNNINRELNHSLTAFRQSLARSRIIFTLKLNKYTADPEVINALRKLRSIKPLYGDRRRTENNENNDLLLMGVFEIFEQKETPSAGTHNLDLRRVVKLTGFSTP